MPVWFTVRTTGTHTGELKFGRASYAPTGAAIRGAPEACSYTFNEEGKARSHVGQGRGGVGGHWAGA